MSTVEDFFSCFLQTRVCRGTPSISQLGRGIRKVVFICGDIRDLVLEADKYIEFLDDPDALTDDFDGLDEEQVEELKRKCVIIFCEFQSLTQA